MKKQKDLLDHVFTLFANQRNYVNDEIVEAAIYFMENHNFDLGELPEKIHDKVCSKLASDVLIRYYDGLALCDEV